MPRALVVIDVQNDYFPGGAHPLVGPDAAADVVADLVARFRDRGERVVFVQHLWDEPDAPYLRKGSPGADIHPSVQPRDDEPVVVKEFPNAFRHTGLAARIEGADGIVVVGMMTNMCVDATVRAALDREIDAVVVADGCAASDLTWGGTTVDGPPSTPRSSPRWPTPARPSSPPLTWPDPQRASRTIWSWTSAIPGLPSRASSGFLPAMTASR